MDYQQIEILLNKYWDCETNQEEERQLTTFFSNGDVPEHLRAYTPFFLVLEEKGKIQGGDSLGEKITNILQKEEKQKPVIVRYFYPFLRIAAGILLLIAMGLGIQTHHNNKIVIQQVYSETYTDPDLAMEEVYEAFDKIAHSLTKAQIAWTELTDSINNK
jgi:hypothetical protein